jgi:hypothetical protein
MAAHTPDRSAGEDLLDIPAPPDSRGLAALPGLNRQFGVALLGAARDCEGWDCRTLQAVEFPLTGTDS